MMISLDGYMEGVDHDLSWHNVDTEFNKSAAEQMKEMGTILMGRRTYDLMHSYWPNAIPEDPSDEIVKDIMNHLPKVVVSHTLEKVDEEDNWKNVKVINTNVAQELARLKEDEGGPASPSASSSQGGPASPQGGDIAVLGSNNLCLTLLELGLLDEIRIMINPVVIGQGTPLFAGIHDRKKFELKDTKTFQNGNILLIYEVGK